MLENIMSIDIFSSGFYLPVIIGLIILLIIAKVAKKLIKFAIFLAVIGLAVLLYLQIR